MDETEALRKKLADLKAKHRQLDDEIAGLSESRPFDQLEIQRLKKRKLALKDEILQVENQLLPDIIA
ncbi:MAG: YdcH family protein [Rhodospirillales bacterium]